MFDWIDFLELAEELADRQGSEAAGRSAISRAYYAAFHVGRDYLDRVRIRVDRSARGHLQVQHVLQTVNPLISQELRRLHAWRKEADYDNPCSFDVELQARDSVALARSIIDRNRAIP